MDFSDLFDYCEAAIEEETDVALRIKRRDELDRLKRHVNSEPPVVLNAEEREQLARALHDHMHRSGRAPLNYDTMAESIREYRRGSIDAILAKLAELGIVLTRDATHG